MKVFLTGATGYIGSAVAEALLAAGHSVAGLARNPEAEQKLRELGVTPVGGDLNSPNSLTSPMSSVDGVIHTGTTNDGHADADAVEAMLAGLKGTDKPFVYTSGVWVLGNTGDTPANESAPVNPPTIVTWRPPVEQRVLGYADQNVRSIVIRPAMVYGRAGGLPGMFVQSANESGAARYIGDGQNRWTMVHVEDLASLYLLAVEHGTAGAIYHGADGLPVRMLELAEAASFGAGAGGRVESTPLDQANAQLGPVLVEALTLDQVVSGEKAKQELGWHTHAVSVLEDLRYGSYAMPGINP